MAQSDLELFRKLAKGTPKKKGEELPISYWQTEYASLEEKIKHDQKVAKQMIMTTEKLNECFSL